MTEKQNLETEELKKAVGGTRQENEELIREILANPVLAAEWEELKKDGHEDEYQLQRLVRWALEKSVVINSGRSRNEYDYGHISHDEVLEIIRNYR